MFDMLAEPSVHRTIAIGVGEEVISIAHPGDNHLGVRHGLVNAQVSRERQTSSLPILKRSERKRRCSYQKGSLFYTIYYIAQPNEDTGYTERGQDTYFICGAGAR